MVKVKILEAKEYDVKYVTASMGVRYWEDATVNGEDEDNESPKMPFALDSNEWTIFIDVDTGKIKDWPQGMTAMTHYKVCDDGGYAFLDEEGALIRSYNGYVPDFMYPNADGYGDYVILNIDGNGIIEGWDPKLVKKFIEDLDIHD